MPDSEPNIGGQLGAPLQPERCPPPTRTPKDLRGATRQSTKASPKTAAKARPKARPEVALKHTPKQPQKHDEKHTPNTPKSPLKHPPIRAKTLGSFWRNKPRRALSLHNGGREAKGSDLPLLLPVLPLFGGRDEKNREKHRFFAKKQIIF